MSATTAEDVSYQWTDYQAHVRDELEHGDHDLVVLRVGYGGGKSRCGAQWIHRGGMADTEGAGESLVLAQDYEKGKSTTYSVFFKTLPGEDTNPFKDGDPEHSPIVDKYNKNDKMLRYVTGHVTWIGGADKWSRFAGGEYCRIWCDEVAHYPPTTNLYDLHEMLVTRQRTDIGPNSTLWTSTGNGFNQFYDVTERQVDVDDEPLPWSDRMHVVVASTEHNTLLPPDGLEKIKRQFEGTEREEQGLHGGFAAAEGLVYNDFTREHHVRPEADVADLVDEEQLPIYGYDAGWDHPRVLVQYRPTHHDQWLATKCYHVSEKPFEHLCDPSKEEGWVYEQDLERGYLYGEHEPEHLLKFKRAGFAVEKADKSLDEGIPHVRGLLERKGDPPRPGLLVSDACSALIQEFLSYKEEHVGSSGDVPDHCFVEGTMVLTETGERPIETIRPGDRVLTRAGYQPVLAAGKTAEDVEVITATMTNGRELTGTANHPIHTPDGFRPLHSLRYADLLTPTPRTVEQCQKLKRSNSRESRSGATRIPTTGRTDTTTDRVASTSRTVSKLSTGKSGDTTTGRSPTGTLSITKTATRPTTIQRISNASLLRSTPNAILSGVATLRGKPSKRRRTGTNRTKAGSGTDDTRKSSGKTPNRKSKSASSAGTSSSTTPGPGSARTPVKRSGGETRASTTSKPRANGAERRSRTTSTRSEDSVRVSAVRDTGTTADVYNLTVLGQPEYYANGVLVHNCLDASRYALFTHTPRQQSDGDSDSNGVSYL